jgi:hypothetical protein
MNATGPVSTGQEGRVIAQLRPLADQAFSRTAGRGGKLPRVAARNFVGTEPHSLRIHSDDIGQQFAEALATKPREGVRVRIIYHWFGALGWLPIDCGGDCGALESRCDVSTHPVLTVPSAG